MRRRETNHGHPAADQMLAAAGLRPTPVRRAVLSVVLSGDGAWSHQKLMEALPKGLCNRVTVYRALQSLAERGVLRRFDPGDRVWRFGPATESPAPQTSEHRRGADHGPRIRGPVEHPHFLCDRCGRTLCLPPVESTRRVPVPRGCRVRVREVLVRGLCAGCAKDDRG